VSQTKGVLGFRAHNTLEEEPVKNPKPDSHHKSPKGKCFKKSQSSLGRFSQIWL
jgi:hypothetical protein